MFDIGFLELLVIATIGLLVLGPERLPGAVRTASLWLGRLRRSFNELRREIEREVGAEELRQQLHNEEVMKSLRKAHDELSDGLNQAGAGLEAQSGLNEVRKLHEDVQDAGTRQRPGSGEPRNKPGSDD